MLSAIIAIVLLVPGIVLISKVRVAAMVLLILAVLFGFASFVGETLINRVGVFESTQKLNVVENRYYVIHELDGNYSKIHFYEGVLGKPVSVNEEKVTVAEDSQDATVTKYKLVLPSPWKNIFFDWGDEKYEIHVPKGTVKILPAGK